MSVPRPHLTPDEIWRKYDSMEARLTARLSARMIDLAALRSAMRVLDLATGRGEPAIPAAHRVGSRGYVLGIDVLAEPERVAYFTWPREFLKRYKDLPPERPDTAGPFRYADAKSLEDDLRRAGFGVQHAEEMDLAVMEVVTASELVAWVRAFGLDRLLDGLPEEVQLSWEADLIAGAEALRADGIYRLGAVTRIVVGRPR